MDCFCSFLWMSWNLTSFLKRGRIDLIIAFGVNKHYSDWVRLFMGWNIALEWCKQRLFTWQEKAELMHNLLAQYWYCAAFSFPLFLGLLILLYVFSLSIYVEFIFLQVGTPGRVLDHLKHTKGFSLDRLKYSIWFLHTHTHIYIELLMLLSSS